MASKLAEQEKIAAIQARAQQIAADAVAAGQADPFAAPHEGLAAALMSIVEAWRADAVALEGDKSRAAGPRQRDLRTAAGLLAAVAVDVGKLPAAGPAYDTPKTIVANPVPGLTTVELPGPDIPGSFGPGEVPINQTLAALHGEPHMGNDLADLAYAADALTGVLDLSQAGPTLPDNQYVDAFKDALIVHPDGSGAQIVAEKPGPGSTGPALLAYLGEGIPNAPQVMPEQREASSYVTTNLTEPGAPMQPTLNYVTTIPAVAFLDPTPKHGAPGSDVTRLSYRDAAALWGQLPPMDHKSHSQITTGEDCGMKALLSLGARARLVPGGQPQWANVGGTAFHLAAQLIETHETAVWEPRQLWTTCFDTTIVDTERETGTMRTDWRVANKGLENYDWWRVQGEEMVKLYLATHTPERRELRRVMALVNPNGAETKALEVPFQLDVEGVRLDGVIDKIEVDTRTGALDIVDYKSGRHEPDTFQLSIYAHYVSRAWGRPLDQISASHWFARKGIMQTYSPADLANLHSWDEIVYRTLGQVAREQARLAMPRVSGFCNGCEFKYLCPAGPRS